MLIGTGVLLAHEMTILPQHEIIGCLVIAAIIIARSCCRSRCESSQRSRQDFSDLVFIWIELSILVMDSMNLSVWIRIFIECLLWLCGFFRILLVAAWVTVLMGKSNGRLGVVVLSVGWCRLLFAWKAWMRWSVVEDFDFWVLLCNCFVFWIHVLISDFTQLFGWFRRGLNQVYCKLWLFGILWETLTILKISTLKDRILSNLRDLF